MVSLVKEELYFKFWYPILLVIEMAQGPGLELIFTRFYRRLRFDGFTVERIEVFRKKDVFFIAKPR